MVQNIRFFEKKRNENEYFAPQMRGSEGSFAPVERIYGGKNRIRFGGKTNKTNKVIEDPRLPEIGCGRREDGSGGMEALICSLQVCTLATSKVKGRSCG